MFVRRDQVVALSMNVLNMPRNLPAAPRGPAMRARVTRPPVPPLRAVTAGHRLLRAHVRVRGRLTPRTPRSGPHGLQLSLSPERRALSAPAEAGDTLLFWLKP